nr:MAG TPA: hypothetical protein [Bacteriophage sp.]
MWQQWEIHLLQGCVSSLGRTLFIFRDDWRKAQWPIEKLVEILQGLLLLWPELSLPLRLL